ncbi:MAG: CBS domain-containing protein [Anaerolineaceae bacterium]|nr:CBS domain-containing protein [Anaerolineaceae bacterium]
MLVKYRMTPDPIIVRPDVSIAEALDQMRQDGVHRYPVVDSRGKLVGIVTESDLLYASPSSVTSLNVWELTYLLSQVKVRSTMTKDVITVDEEAPIEDAARLMRDHDVGGLPVMRRGKLVGIITESDLFDVFLELLMAQEAGLRLTVLAPYVKGSMAQITAAISEAGGLIHSLNSFVPEDPEQWGCILKVADISREKLLEAVEPLVLQVLDIREIEE